MPHYSKIWGLRLATGVREIIVCLEKLKEMTWAAKQVFLQELGTGGVPQRFL